ncbi:MAG TPA: dockerin type I repeat-containing protein, partial [Acetivibrio clariflavus]|nr:dockerin type I repeat-containing protein [Acetivibrio clariflavus]
PIPNPTPTPTSNTYLVGDVNHDNNINSIDYALMKSYLLGMKLPENTFFKNEADVNGDGDINSVDYALLKQRLLGMISKFPVEE